MIGFAAWMQGAFARRSRSKTSLNRRTTAPALALVLAALGAAPASAQIPKAFVDYEDKSDLGFKVKVPKDWNFIPATPGDPNLIGKYDGNADQGIQIGGTYKPWQYSVWLVKFDRRKPASDGAAPKEGEPIVLRGAKNVEEYLPELNIPGSWKKLDKLGGPLGIQGVEATASVYGMKFKETDVQLRLYVASYKLSPELDIALIANCAGDEKKWSKHEGALNTMGRSFKRVDVVAAGAATVVAGESALRTKTRAVLSAKMKKEPGWTLYETPNYFIVSNNPDLEFIKTLKVRLEAIRKVYEETYPVEKALELRKRRDEALAKKKAEEPPSGKPEGEPEAKPPEDEEDHTEAQSATPLEQSRCSVVRVVKNQEQYDSYGGPKGSAGYWSAWHKELVIYDDKAVGGRGDTWITLNHEAFHQYIYYLLGNLSPHSWYNEGTGDFYSGYQIKNGRFELKPNDWRVQTIKDALRQRTSGKQTFAPLKELARWTQAEYYGKNKYELDGIDNYAQGWSFIWFLRTGAKNCRAWNPAWNSILDTYLETLAVTNEHDQSIDTAFAGVDWDELEKAWIDYTLAI